MAFQTEYEFTLPSGYVDESGLMHRLGVMRLATAADELMSMRDKRVQENPSYLAVLILSRVVTRLGTLTPVSPAVIEGLFARDFAFLNDMYERINGPEELYTEAVCPQCGCHHKIPLSFTKEG